MDIASEFGETLTGGSWKIRGFLLEYPSTLASFPLPVILVVQKLYGVRNLFGRILRNRCGRLADIDALSLQISLGLCLLLSSFSFRNVVNGSLGDFGNGDLFVCALSPQRSVVQQI